MYKISLGLILLGVSASGMIFGMEEALIDVQVVQNQDRSIITKIDGAIDYCWNQMEEIKKPGRDLRSVRTEISQLSSEDGKSDKVALKLEGLRMKKAHLIKQLKNQELDPEAESGNALKVFVLEVMLLPRLYYAKNVFLSEGAEAAEKVIQEVFELFGIKSSLKSK